MFFDNRHKHIDRNGAPDLALDGIFGRAEKRFDSEMLFDPFKKELHLPSIAIEFGDGLRWNGKVVGEKVEGLVGLAIVEFDSSKWLRIGVLGGGSGQHDRLIASQSMGVVDGMRVSALVPGIALGANDEECPRLRECEQSLEVQIPAIHDVECARLWEKDIEDVDIVQLAIRDMEKGRNIASYIE